MCYKISFLTTAVVRKRNKPYRYLITIVTIITKCQCQLGSLILTPDCTSSLYKAYDFQTPSLLGKAVISIQGYQVVYTVMLGFSGVRNND